MLAATSFIRRPIMTTRAKTRQRKEPQTTNK
jgi:hypothetical protein